MSKFVYLDYNATTPVLPAIATAYHESLTPFGNPSSLHQYGQQTKAILEKSRRSVARGIDANASQIIFTSSGSEGNNQILQSLWRRSLQKKRSLHVITSAIEHSSIRVTLDTLSQFGVNITVLPVDKHGHVSVDAVRHAITPETGLISVMLANNEIGTIQPVSEICEIAHQHNILVHTDAVQALGKMPISTQNIPVDFMTISAHKIYAPKGSAALYIRDDATIDALIYGGGHERKLRAGTENISGIVAFSESFSYLSGPDEWRRQRGLLDKIVSKIKQQLNCIVVHTDHHSGLSNTLNLGIDNLDGHALAINLDLAGIGVSTGSACATGSIEPSPVLAAMGMSPSLNIGSIRVSVGKHTTEAEGDYFADQYIAIVKRMRS